MRFDLCFAKTKHNVLLRAPSDEIKHNSRLQYINTTPALIIEFADTVHVDIN